MKASSLPSLEWLRRQAVLSPLDVHLAALLQRSTGENRPEVLLATALASQWPQRGHTCLDLADLTPDQLTPAGEWAADSGMVESLPELDPWLAALADSPLVGRPGDHRPLIMADKRLLYLHRLWTQETDIARKVQAWQQTAFVPPDDFNRRVDRLFGKGDADGRAGQKRAAFLACSHPFFLLTGGPGTGKTTTVLRILALLLEVHPGLRIAIAAPTGKAALRLQDSIAIGRDGLDCPDSVRAEIPATASTLHRLLGYRHHDSAFKHHARNPLPHDLVVVDEASMMDSALAARLVQALAPEARLILVGDREQLPSVEAGAVFADLCAVPTIPSVELTHNFRFSQSQGVGGLAALIRRPRPGGLYSLTNTTPKAQLQLNALPAMNRLKTRLWERLDPLFEALRKVSDPEEAFACLERFRVLCAYRTGPFGSDAVNLHAAERLRTRGWIDTHRWYPGRPLLITENDYNSNLYNGDTGIVLSWKGKLCVFFRESDGGFRRLPPARLPAHDSAYAMTVHKSQGSEFDRVLLILGDHPTPLLSRELLYTGVTRARHGIEIWGARSLVEHCMETPTFRTTGLRHHLQSPAPPLS